MTKPINANPRAGFGKIHIFNDYNYKNPSYGIGYHTECKVLAESNYFEGMDKCIDQMYDGRPDEMGDLESRNNKFVDADEGDGRTGTGFFNPSELYIYDFLMDNVDDVANIVKASSGVGAQYGEIGLMPTPGQGTVGVSNSTLSWKTGTKSPSSYVVYFGTTTNPPQVAASSDTSYNAGSLSSGTQYYWRVDQVTTNGTIPGKRWTFKAE